jgi:hypothetical protein
MVKLAWKILGLEVEVVAVSVPTQKRSRWDPSTNFKKVSGSFFPPHSCSSVCVSILSVTVNGDFQSWQITVRLPCECSSKSSRRINGLTLIMSVHTSTASSI